MRDWKAGLQQRGNGLLSTVIKMNNAGVRRSWNAPGPHQMAHNPRRTDMCATAAELCDHAKGRPGEDRHVRAVAAELCDHTKGRPGLGCLPLM